MIAFSDWNELYSNVNQQQFCPFSYDDGIICNTHLKNSFFSRFSDSIIIYSKNEEVIIVVENCAFKRISTHRAGAIACVENCHYFQSKVCCSLCLGFGDDYESSAQCLKIVGKSFINSSNFYECGEKKLDMLLNLMNSSLTQINISDIHLNSISFFKTYGEINVEYTIVKNTTSHGMFNSYFTTVSLSKCDFVCNKIGYSFSLSSNPIFKSCKFVGNIDSQHIIQFGFGQRIEFENCFFEDNNFSFSDNVVWTGENASSFENNFEFFDMQKCYSKVNSNNSNQACCDNKPQFSCGCLFVFSDRYLSVVSLIILNKT